MKRETSMCIYGVIKKNEKAPGGVELSADYYEVIGSSHVDIENAVNQVRAFKLRSCYLSSENRTISWFPRSGLRG